MSGVETLDRPPGLTRGSSERLSFRLPPELEASEPPEDRGLTRDAVRLMIARRGDDRIVHSTFGLLPMFLEPGDLIVINTSGTLAAAVHAVAEDGTNLVVHFSSQLDSTHWIVEPRRCEGIATQRWLGPPPASPLRLGDGASLTLDEPQPGSRLWSASVHLPQPVLTWLAVHGRPIRYGYVPHPWPLARYQNVYATQPGSAEMPSAGRPFTPEIITRLVAKGIGVTPLVLHTGVASVEAGEVPAPERVTVPPWTADRVNETHSRGGRVVAVGTTTVRALESATTADGVVNPLEGWTDLVITAERGVQCVDGLLTGWHEPEASHLVMLEAVGGRRLLDISYSASLAERYMWHEFGDMHLILR